MVIKLDMVITDNKGYTVAKSVFIAGNQLDVEDLHNMGGSDLDTVQVLDSNHDILRLAYALQQDDDFALATEDGEEIADIARSMSSNAYTIEQEQLRVILHVGATHAIERKLFHDADNNSDLNELLEDTLHDEAFNSDGEIYLS